MARKHEIAIASETGAFEKGIKSGVVQPLEDAEKALKDLGDTDVGRDIDRDLDAAQKATKRLKDETKDAADQIEKAFRQSYKKVKDDADDASTKMKAGFSEAADEAQQSGREAAASFSGGFEDVADFVQETLANALSGFGPIGAAAGIALATTLGLALGQAAAAQEKLQEARERAAELANTIYENRGDIPMAERLGEMFDRLAEESGSGNVLLDMIDQWVDFGSTLDAVKRSAELTGNETSKLVEALSGGDMHGAQDALDDINEKIRELEGNAATAWAWNPDLQALREARTEIEKTVEAEKTAAEIAAETGAVRAGRVQDLADAWRDAGVQLSNYFQTGEDGTQTFDAAAYIADWEEQIAKADEVKADLLSLPQSIREEAERQWASGGVGAADAYVDAYQGADAATKAKLQAIAGPQGQAAGRAAADGFVSAADQGMRGFVPPAIVARIGVDDSAIRNYRPPTLHIPGRIVARGTVQFTD